MPTSPKLSEDILLDLSTVSSLYAPGNFTAWLLVALSVLVDATTYSLSRLSKRRKYQRTGTSHATRNNAGNRSSSAYRLLRKIIPLDPNVIGALTYPLVAAADVLQRRELFNDGEDFRKFYSAEAKRPGLEEIAATIAPATVCQVASVVLPMCYISSAIIEHFAKQRPSSPDEIRGEKEKEKNRTLRELFADHFGVKPYAFFLTTVLVNLALASAPCEDRLNVHIARAAGLTKDETLENTVVSGVKFTVSRWIETSANIPRNQQLCKPILGKGNTWLKIALWVPLFSLLRIYQCCNPQGYLDDHDWRKKRTPASTYLYDTRDDVSKKFKPGALFIMVLNWIVMLGNVPCIVYGMYLVFHAFVDMLSNMVLLVLGPITTKGWSNLPTTSAKISDLDQLVAIIGGVCALGYSLFSCLVEYAEFRDIKMFLVKAEEEDDDEEEEYKEYEKEGEEVAEIRGLLQGGRARKRVPTLDMDDARDRAS